MTNEEKFEAMRAATYSHVDGRDLLHEMRLNGAHYVNIHVRIDGQWKVYEGDWLKTLMWARDGHNKGERFISVVEESLTTDVTNSATSESTP